jgi:hypothetical protein
MKMKKIITFIGILIVFFQTGFTQNIQPEWNVLSRVGAGGTSIKLRWMPPTASSWNSGVGSGYSITRTTYTSTGAISTSLILPVISGPTIPTVPRVLGSDTISTKWVNYWKNDSTVYKYLMYITINKLIPNSSINAPVNDSTQLSNPEERFFFANVLADSKFKAAELCGLGFTDNDVVPGTKYSYVITNIATNEVSPSTGIITASFTNLPDIPINFSSDPRRLKINWGNANLWDFYGGYYIEKSINAGASYSRLNDVPYVDMADSTNSMVFVDSIPNANATYRYRVVGIGYFDELKYGTPKDTTIIKVQEFSPGINRIKAVGSNFKVDWKYPYSNPKNLPVNVNNDISSYTIGVSRDANAKLGTTSFKTIASNISKTDTTFQFTKSTINSLIGDTLTNRSIYYYYVVSFGPGGTNGLGKDTVYSTPYAYKPIFIDNVPPSTPTLGKVNEPTPIGNSSKLLIKVSWNKSTDNDGVLGYRVFRTIGTDLEKIEVSGGIVNNLDGATRALTNDTVAQNLDFKIIKYYVTAFDSSYNESGVHTISYSQKDKRRPMPASFKSASLVTNGTNPNSVLLIFRQSPSKKSENIIHEIYRKENTPGQSWSVIKTIANAASDTSYVDVATLDGKTYSYSILAKDDSLNYSCDSIPTLSGTIIPLPSYCYPIITISTLVLKIKPALSTLTQTYTEASKSITLNWTYSQPNIVGYEIYRGTLKPSVTTKSAFLDYAPGGAILSYMDSKIDFDSTYLYRVRANFTDGSVSAWKEVQSGIIKQSKLNLDKSSLTFERIAGSQVVAITSNISWTIASNATWLTTSISSGSNNQNININVLANTGATKREGILTISGSGIEVTISVTQFAPATGTGLTAQYFNYSNLADIQTRSPNISVLENQVNIATSGIPKAGIYEDFVILWEGEIEVPNNGAYVFYLNADDGANLYINNLKILTSSFGESASPTINLLAGQKYPIKIEFWDSNGWAFANLKWSNNVGLSKQVLTTPYLYPKFVPTANDADPLNNNCFVIRNPSTDKTFQTPNDYSFRELPFISKNYQKWKFVKNGSSYNIISQIDGQNKSLQVINDGNTLYDKLTISYLGNKVSEKWNVTKIYGNTYQIQRNASSYYIGGSWDQYPRLFSGGQNLNLEPTECPNYSSGIIMDTDNLVYDYKQQTKTLILKSDIEWSTINNNDWINITPNYGLQNTTVNVFLTRNNSLTPRNGTLGFKSVNGIVNVQINQGPAPCLDVLSISTGCAVNSIEGINIAPLDEVTTQPYEFRLDSNINWVDATWKLGHVSNGDHIIYVRRKNSTSCQGSKSFSVYCN